MLMEVEFDPRKDEANRSKHGVRLLFGIAVLSNLVGEEIDRRRDYGEVRQCVRYSGRSAIRLHLYDARRGFPVYFGAQCKQAGEAVLVTLKVTPALVEQVIRETDWARLDAMTDEEIARNVASDPDAPPLMSHATMAAGVVRVIRQKLGITQAEFSKRFRIPIGTLRDWEQNRKQPDSTAIAYLRVISKEPELVAKVQAA